MNVAASEYAGALVPAFEAGMQESVLAPHEIGNTFEERAQQCLGSVLTLVREYDWDNSGLPRGSVSKKGEQRTLPPAEFAEFLTLEAFSDAATLMELCANSTKERNHIGQWILKRIAGKEIPTDATDEQPDMRELLLNSKLSILNNVVRMRDYSKSQLLLSVKNPGLSRLYMGMRFYESPIQRTQPDDLHPGFVWSDQVQHWIADNTKPEDGCPAHKIIVSGTDGRQPLTHYLWDGLAAMRFS